MRSGAKIIALLAGGLLISLVVSSLIAPRTRLELPRRTLPPSASQAPQPTMTVFDLPGSDGARLTARFYGVERFMPSGDDYCPALKARLLRLPQPPPADAPADDDAEPDAATLVDLACGGIPKDTGKPVPEAERGSLAVRALREMSGQDGQPPVDEATATIVARWALRELRRAATVGEVAEILHAVAMLRDAPDHRGGLLFARFRNDAARVSAQLCPKSDTFDCRTQLLTNIGETYARIGRMGDEEQSFRDMEEVLNEAEPLVRKTSDRATRFQLLGRIASAFGYGGEAGRSTALMERGVAIAEKSVAELTPGKDGDDSERYLKALNQLASNLGRLAGRSPDRVAATTRAIEASEKAIAHQELHFPDRTSWAVYINIAADQRDMFELTLKKDWIEKSVPNARRARELLGGGPPSKEARDIDEAYVNVRLAQALAWQAKYGKEMSDGDRRDRFDEAKELLAAAEPYLRRTNAQAYLRIIASTRPLLAKEAESP